MEKVFIFITEQVWEGEDAMVCVQAYATQERAIERLQEWKADNIKDFDEAGWTITENSETSFEACQEGEFMMNHAFAHVEEREVL